MVTHEHEMASFARRIVHSGMVWLRLTRQTKNDVMFSNTFLLALREIRRNVLRSFLTILGIVIGVGSGDHHGHHRSRCNGPGNGTDCQFGSNLLMVRTGQRMGPGNHPARLHLILADAQAIFHEIPAVAVLHPHHPKSHCRVRYANWATTVMGVDNQFFTVRNWTIRSGRQFQETELRSGKAVCIIGATIAKELYGAQDPLATRYAWENSPVK